PEVKLPDCNSNSCKSTLAAISITCMNNDGKVEIDQTYNFFRLKTSIIDTNVFLPPSGVFCNSTNKNKFPGLPSYFSFSYDLIDEQEETGIDPGVFAVHKKVWYDSKMNILRMDEFEDDGSLIASRVFDVKGGVAYTSISSLSTCEMGPVHGEDVSLDEMTRLPKVFFRGEKALNEAVYVGTRHIHALDYEVWSLMSVDKETYQKTVQDFYFTKDTDVAASVACIMGATCYPNLYDIALRDYLRVCLGLIHNQDADVCVCAQLPLVSHYHDLALLRFPFACLLTTIHPTVGYRSCSIWQRSGRHLCPRNLIATLWQIPHLRSAYAVHPTIRIRMLQHLWQGAT
ncbi:hypothetical protein AVEN_223719-1, partial [Araneus ventricosus]